MNVEYLETCLKEKKTIKNLGDEKKRPWAKELVMDAKDTTREFHSIGLIAKEREFDEHNTNIIKLKLSKIFYLSFKGFR